MKTTYRVPSLLVVLLSSGCSVVFRHHEGVTPQRPTVSSDAKTTAQGTVELELGAAFDPSDSFEVPAAVKVGTGPRTEVFLGWSPYLHLDLPVRDDSDHGDLRIGVRHRFLELEPADTVQAAALGAAVKIPSDDRADAFTTGELDGFFSLAVEGAARDLSWVGFYELGLLGEPASSGVDVQNTAAFALGRSLTPDLGAFGELAWIDVAEVSSDDRLLLTLGLNTPLLQSLVLDGAVVVGLTDDSPDFAVLVGLTDNLGRLFQAPGPRAAPEPPPQPRATPPR